LVSASLSGERNLRNWTLVDVREKNKETVKHHKADVNKYKVFDPFYRILFRRKFLEN
jgi:hypothetical protein